MKKHIIIGQKQPVYDLIMKWSIDTDKLNIPWEQLTEQEKIRAIHTYGNIVCTVEKHPKNTITEILQEIDT